MNTKRRAARLALALCPLLLSAPLLAKERHLGSTRLARSESDIDLVHLPPCNSTGKVSEIQLRISKGDVEIEKLWVRFHNGDVEKLDVKKRFEQGEKSRWIDLEGRKRCVNAIGVIGDTEHSSDQARVDFYGR